MTKHRRLRDVPHAAGRARVAKGDGTAWPAHSVALGPGAQLVRVFGLSMGYGYPMRAITIYERLQPALFAEATR